MNKTRRGRYLPQAHLALPKFTDDDVLTVDHRPHQSLLQLANFSALGGRVILPLGVLLDHDLIILLLRFLQYLNS